MGFGLLGATALSAGFVGSLYIWKGATTQSRDEIPQIKRRMLSVSLVSLAGAALVAADTIMNSSTSHPSSSSIIHRLGLPTFPSTLSSSELFKSSLPISLPLTHTASLFLGPLALLHAEGELSSTWSSFKAFCVRLATKSTYPDDWLSIRNLAVGPLTEEVVFRACNVALLSAAGFSRLSSIWISSALFGLAHGHHVLEKAVKQRVPLKRAILGVAFQVAFTSLFGSYAAGIFTATNSVLAATLVHSFCNWMGLPAVDEIFSHPKRKKSLIFALFAGIAVFAASFSKVMNPATYA